MNFDDIKKWYDLGLWTKEMVYQSVPKIITPAEYQIITGEEYIPGEELARIEDYNAAMLVLGVTHEEA